MESQARGYGQPDGTSTTQSHADVVENSAVWVAIWVETLANQAV